MGMRGTPKIMSQQKESQSMNKALDEALGGALGDALGNALGSALCVLLSTSRVKADGALNHPLCECVGGDATEKGCVWYNQC